MRKSWIAIIGAALTATAGAQVSFTGNYSQDFDTLVSSGTANPWTDNSTIQGWYMRRVNDPDTELADQYNAGTGSSNAGAVYSFGADGSAERALGSVGSGSLEHAAYGLRLTNATGGDITQLQISFVGEQWRDGGNTTPVAHTSMFSYSLTSTTIGADTQPTGGVSGYSADPNFTTDTTFDLVTPVFGTTATALDGNLATNQTVVNATLNLSSAWADGTDLWIRWVDVNNIGNDMGMALDNLTITGAPVPEPASMAALGLGAIALLRRRTQK